MKKLTLFLSLLLSACAQQNTSEHLIGKNYDVESRHVKKYGDAELCGRVISWKADVQQTFPSVAFNELIERHPDWRSKSRALTAPPPLNASVQQISCLWGGGIKERSAAIPDATAALPKVIAENTSNDQVDNTPAPPSYSDIFIGSCEDQAKSQLKSPISAIFTRGQITPGRTWMGQEEYWGVIDSQNSYGAMIRNHFQCLRNSNGSIGVFFFTTKPLAMF